MSAQTLVNAIDTEAATASAEEDLQRAHRQPWLAWRTLRLYPGAESYVQRLARSGVLAAGRSMLICPLGTKALPEHWPAVHQHHAATSRAREYVRPGRQLSPY